ncbi:hypothetical protein V8D89_000264 [Ganoderma adspersum]
MSTTNQILSQAVQDLLTTLSGELSSSDISTLRLVDDALSNLLRATVRIRLNECAAVNRLPPEILSTIFDLLRSNQSCSGDIDGRYHAILRPDTRSLIAVTHVCRRWRDISLGCAQLWTNVSTISPLAPKFFERSQEMSLTVFVSLVRGRPPPVPKQVFLNQFPRIKVLHIDLECSAQIRHWRKHLQSLARSLESLTVVTHGRESHVRANPLLVMPFFGTECPVSLRFLSISGTTVLIPADRFPALQYAHLSVSPPGIGPGVRFQQLMIWTLIWGLLRNTPRLETLHLHLQSAHSHRLSEESPALERIALPMMRHLCITLPRIATHWARGTDGHFGPVRTMLSCLDMPATTVVSVQEASSCSSSDTQAGAMPYLCILPSAGPSPESAVSVGSDGTAFIVRGTSTTYFKYSSCITPDTIQSFVTAWRPGRLPTPVRERTEAALATVRALRIHSSPRWLASAKSFCLHRPASGEALARLAPLITRLTTLVLRDYTGEMAAHLVRMLVRDKPVLCPGLASVTYITLGRPCDVRTGRFAPAAMAAAEEAEAKAKTKTETAMATETGMGTPVLDAILGATSVRAYLLGRPLERLVFCCPVVTHDRVLERTHGVTRVEVRGADAWAGSLDGDGDSVFSRGVEGCRVPAENLNLNAPARKPKLPGANAEQNQDIAPSSCGLRGPARGGCYSRMPEEEYDSLWTAERERVRFGCRLEERERERGVGQPATLAASGYDDARCYVGVGQGVGGDVDGTLSKSA